MSDLEVYKLAYDKLMEAIDNHYEGTPEFNSLVDEAEDLVSRLNQKSLNS